MKTLKKTNLLLASMLSTSILSGCATISGLEKTDKNIKQDIESIEYLSKKYSNNKYTKIVDKPYYGNSVIVKKEDPILSLPITFDSKPLTIDELASMLSNSINMPIRISFDIPKDMYINDPSFTAGKVDPKNSAYTVGHIRYKGDIKGLLNKVAALTKTTWSLKDGSIVFKRYITKTYDLSVVFGSLNMSQIISSTNANGGANSSNTNTVSSSGIDSYDELTKNLKNMLSNEGKFQVYKSSSMVTVTDTFEKIEEIDEFFEKFNAKMSKNITIYGKLFVVTESEDNDLSFEMALNNVTKELKITNSFSGAASDNAGNLSAGIIKDNGQINIDLFLKTLNKYIKTTSLKNINVKTQNNQITPNVQVTEQSYLEQVSSSITATGLSQTSLTPGKVSSGFSFNMIPSLTGDNKINLQISFDINNLTALNKDSSNNSSITTPTVDKNSLWQRVVLDNNSTVILSDITNGSNSLKEISSVMNGIGQSGSIKKTRVFMILKAQVE